MYIFIYQRTERYGWSSLTRPAVKVHKHEPKQYDEVRCFLVQLLSNKLIRYYRASLQRRDRSSRLKERTPLTISTVRTFSSSNSIKLTNVELTSESTTVENDSPQMCSQDCNLVVRRGSNLLLHLTLSQPLTSSLYTISLTFIPVYGPRERSSIFRASGKGKRKIELWLSVPLPANFPVGKYDTHVSLSLQSHVEILTHTVHSAVVVLFNPWHHSELTMTTPHSVPIVSIVLLLDPIR